MLPRGLFLEAPGRGESANLSEDVMTEARTHNYSRYATRAALVGLGLYLALVVGVPWLVTAAPPSVQDVVASKVCCMHPAAATLHDPRGK